jgi:hypothetical protein
MQLLSDLSAVCLIDSLYLILVFFFNCEHADLDAISCLSKKKPAVFNFVRFSPKLINV